MSNKDWQNSMEILSEADKVRKKVNTVFGMNNEEGAQHGIIEIITNSIDEAKEGYGDTIQVNVYNDGVVEVIDHGRGLPMGWNEKAQKYNWEIACCTLYASGKYDGSNYSKSAGTNGIGLSAMQFASEFMKVEACSGGKTYLMKFKEGQPISELSTVDTPNKKSGTRIKFKPDKNVFRNIGDYAFPFEFYAGELIKMAMLNPKVTLKLFYEPTNENHTFSFERGPAGYLDEAFGNTFLEDSMLFEGEAEGTDDPVKEPDKYKVEMRFAVNFSANDTYFGLYHNSLPMTDGGVTLNAVKKAMVTAFEMALISTGKMGKNDQLKFTDIESNLLFIGDTTAPGYRTYFKHQTKTAIDNKFIGEAFTQFIFNNIYAWLTKSPEEAEKILKQVLANKQAREEADKVSKKVIQQLNKQPTKFGNKPEKFSDCTDKNPENRELWIVEGDSAKSSCMLARDYKTQAIMPVRGKILNCLKEEMTRILSSEIIVDLLRILGCGIEAKAKHIDGLPKFDITKLNFDKIILCTDADSDGMQIRCLLISMIYRLCPSLLRAGKVYIAETPLYELYVNGKESDSEFAYTQDELPLAIQRLIDKGYKESSIKINRSKGLGENNPDMMRKSTMHPDTRRLIQVEYEEDEQKIASIFDALLGNDIESRRAYIDDYFIMTDEQSI